MKMETKIKIQMKIETKIKILIDNGHGQDTKWKRSPDESLREWEWTREIAARVVEKLKKRGYDASLLTPEVNDISLRTRVDRVNELCDTLGSKNVLLVSIHNNASRSDRKWDTDKPCRGFSVFVSKKASGRSKDLAEIFFGMAKNRNMLGNRSIPAPDANGRHFWTWSWRKEDIYILTETKCPAVLTENFFMDNKEDCEYLLSDLGKEECVRIHVDAITRYIEES